MLFYPTLRLLSRAISLRLFGPGRCKALRKEGLFVTVKIPDMDILRPMGDWFIRTPSLALVPSSLAGLIWYRTRRRAALFAGLAWGLYSVYEYLMKARILCSGECNIRIDLLLIYPLLLALSVIAAAALFAKGGGGARHFSI